MMQALHKTTILPVTWMRSEDACSHISACPPVLRPTYVIRQLLGRLPLLMTIEHGVASPLPARATALNQRSITIPP